MSPQEAHAGAASWQNLERVAPEGLTHTAEVCEELQPMGKAYTGEVYEGVSLMAGTLCWSRGRV